MLVMKFRNIALLAAFAFLWASTTFGQPSIAGVSGTLSDGSTLTISGSNFGTKSPAKPQVWAPMKTDTRPSNLGVVTSWNAGFTGNMEWSSDDGGSARSTPLGQTSAGFAVWYAGGNSAFTYGTRNYLYRRVKSNVLMWVGTNDTASTTNNYKNIRYFYTPDGVSMGMDSIPQIYNAMNNGGAFIVGGDNPCQVMWADPSFVQGDSNPLSLLRPRNPDHTQDTTHYYSEEYLMQGESADKVCDGIYHYVFNGVWPHFERNQVVTDKIGYSSGTNFPNLFTLVNFVMANTDGSEGPWTPPWDKNNYRSWVKDVYFDLTWARVMISDHSTWSDNYATSADFKQLAPQIPSAWSSTSITVTVNQGPFSSLSGKYLYVVDSNGKVNANGFPLSSVGSGSSVQTPANLQVQ